MLRTNSEEGADRPAACHRGEAAGGEPAGHPHLRIEAELRLGRHHQLLGGLATLRAQHPMLENFCNQHMVASYRSGRQSQALEAYRRLRANLVGEFGVEPSPRARRPHNGILTEQPVLDDPNFVFSH